MSKVKFIRVHHGEHRDRATGILRRPLIIEERIATADHFCEGCDEWFEADRSNQRYHDDPCRNKAARKRQKLELASLRKRK